MKAFYIDNLKNDPQILIDNVVHKVILYDDSVTIFFNSPISTGLDESQGFLFYEKKHHIDSKSIDTQNRENPDHCKSNDIDIMRLPFYVYQITITFPI